MQSFSLDDFYFLNPEINADCKNLQFDVAYCVSQLYIDWHFTHYSHISHIPFS